MSRAKRASVRAIRTAGIAAAIASLAGADAPPSSPSAGHPIRIAMMLAPSERPFWEPIARGFEAKSPGVSVELVEGPQSTDLREDLYTSSLLARDTSFDLVYMDVTWTAKFAAAGWILPLDDLLDADERGSFLPGTLDAGIFGRHLYRIPVRTDLGFLFYRRDLLDRAGLRPPENFEDLIRDARALSLPPSIWGFVWQGMQYEGLVCTYLEVLGGYGGFWIDPKTLEVGLDRPEAAEALGFLRRCVREERISPPGVTTYQEEESRRLFQDGRAVFMRNWPYAWRLLQADTSPVHGKVGVRPMVAAAGGRPAAVLGGWGLGVSRFSRNAGTAARFIRHVIAPESQRALCRESGFAPARADAYRDPELLKANPFLAEVAASHRYAVLRPALPSYDLASDILQRHLSAALVEGGSPASELAAAARETRQMLIARAESAGVAR